MLSTISAHLNSAQFLRPAHRWKSEAQSEELDLTQQCTLVFSSTKRLALPRDRDRRVKKAEAFALLDEMLARGDALLSEEDLPYAVTSLYLQLPVAANGALQNDVHVYTIDCGKHSAHGGDPRAFITHGDAQAAVQAEHERLFSKKLVVTRKPDTEFTVNELQQTVSRFLRMLGTRAYVRLLIGDHALYFRDMNPRTRVPLSKYFSCNFRMLMPTAEAAGLNICTLALPRFEVAFVIDTGTEYRQTTFPTSRNGLLAVKHLGAPENPYLTWVLRESIDGSHKLSTTRTHKTMHEVRLTENTYLFQTDFGDRGQIDAMAQMMCSMHTVNLLFTDGDVRDYDVNLKTFRERGDCLLLVLAQHGKAFIEEVLPE